MALRRAVRTTLRAAWWWLPGLILVSLLLLRMVPDLQQWRIAEVRLSECGLQPQARAQQLPMFIRGVGCMLLKAEHDLAGQDLQDRALLLSGVGRDVRIWINGVQVRQFDPNPHFDSTTIPLLQPLHSSTLLNGSNEILLQLRSGSGLFDRSFVGALLVGPNELLQSVHRRSIRIGAEGAQLSIVVALAIVLMALPIAWSRPGDSSYRWFVLAVLSSQIYVWNMAWPLRPAPTLLWHLLAHGGLAIALWSISRYSLRVAGRTDEGNRRLDQVALVGLAGLLLAVFDTSGGNPALVGDVVFRISLLAQLLMLANFWWHRRDNALARWMACAAMLCLWLGITDSLRVFGILSPPLSPYVLHWGILYVLGVLLVSQLRHMLAALATAERSQERLSEALDQRSRQLQREFTLRQQAEQAQALAEERQRIMRDMHDGVGGQLVALIGQVEAGKLDVGLLKPQLRRSLDDLRLMIDSLDDACADLSVALGMLRQRLQPSLKGLPLEVHWQTAHLPDLAPCPPEVVLQVLRIVQESITNAIKHARCHRLAICADWADGWLKLSISDDGVGLPANAPPGRGLPGMRQRAAGISAELQISALQPGTRIELRLRLGRA